MSVNLALSNYNAQQAYSKMTSFVNSFSRPITTKVTSYEGITDSVKLSTQSISQFSREWIKKELDNAAAEKKSGEYKSLDELSLNYAENLAGFGNKIRRVMYSNDLLRSSGIVLQTDGLGHIVSADTVSGGEQSKINSALRGSIGLTADYMQVAAGESIINHLKDAPEFIENYTDDPQQTLVANEASLREYILKLQVTVTQGGVTTGLAEPIYS